MAEIAVIGGSGVYDPDGLENVRDVQVDTPYGIVRVKLGQYAGREIAFIPRHGSRHSIPPHKINYRANIWAIKKLGVKKILATTAVGSLNPQMKPGDFVLVDQFLDFTKSRAHTFYEGGERGVAHVDMTEPYCPVLRKELMAVGEKLGFSIQNGGTYVCTEGPRFETPAEIRMFRVMGGDLVGMTNVPEVVLAQEAEMCYATISMVTNFAAGISSIKLTNQEVQDTMRANGANIRSLIMHMLETMTLDSSGCDCEHMLAEVGGFTL